MTTEQISANDNLDMDDLRAMADRLGARIVKVSDFTNRWPNRQTAQVGRWHRGQQIVGLSRIYSDGGYYAAIR